MGQAEIRRRLKVSVLGIFIAQVPCFYTYSCNSLTDVFRRAKGAVACVTKLEAKVLIIKRYIFTALCPQVLSRVTPTPVCINPKG